MDEIKPAIVKTLTTHNTDEEKIIQFLQGKLERTELSKKLDEKITLMQECADLIRTYGSRVKVTKTLQSLHGMSHAKAYRLFDETQRIFGTTSSHDQQFWVDILLGGLMEDIRLAKAKGDFRSVASLRKTMKDTIKELLGSADASLYERIQPKLPVIGFWPEELKSGVPTDPEELKKLIDKFKAAKRKKAYDQYAEDAETN